jgi:hypothetical protein
VIQITRALIASNSCAAGTKTTADGKYTKCNKLTESRLGLSNRSSALSVFAGLPGNSRSRNRLRLQFGADPLGAEQAQSAQLQLYQAFLLQ